MFLFIMLITYNQFSSLVHDVRRSADKTIKCWDVTNPTVQLCWSLPAHNVYVSSIHKLPDGRVITGSGDKTLKLWTYPDGSSK